MDEETEASERVNNLSRDFSGGTVGKTLRSQHRGPDSTPGQGTRPHMLQLRVHMLQLKILHATTKTRCNQKK